MMVETFLYSYTFYPQLAVTFELPVGSKFLSFKQVNPKAGYFIFALSDSKECEKLAFAMIRTGEKFQPDISPDSYVGSLLDCGTDCHIFYLGKI